MSHAALLVALNCEKSQIEVELDKQMKPFCEDGEFFADGSRWDYYLIGGRYDGKLMGNNIIQLKDLSPNACIEYKKKCAVESYDRMQRDKKERGFTPVVFKVIYGYDINITLEELIKEKTKVWFPTHYAFLRDYKWHESDRLGWFGMPIKTECEMKQDEPKHHRCKAKSKGLPEAYVVSWGDDDDTWNFKFYDRFIKHLSPETWLVTVDYHV